MTTIRIPSGMSLAQLPQQQQRGQGGQQFVTLKQGPGGTFTLANAEDLNEQPASQSNNEQMFITPIQSFSGGEQHFIAISGGGNQQTAHLAPSANQLISVPRAQPNFSTIGANSDSSAGRSDVAYRLVQVPTENAGGNQGGQGVGQVLVPVSGGGMIAISEESIQPRQNQVQFIAVPSSSAESNHERQSTSRAGVSNRISANQSAKKIQGQSLSDFFIREGGIFSAGAPSGGNSGFQIQTVDTGKGQCYLLMAPNDSAALANPVIVSSSNNNQSATSSRQFSANQLFSNAKTETNSATVPQATFIPLSRLDSTLVSTNSGGQAVSTSGELKAHGHNLSIASSAVSELQSLQQSGSGGSGEGVYKEKRRSSHNEVEKRRRDKINLWIDKLAKMLPDCEPDDGRVMPTSMNSKGGVLSKTVDFIQQLKDTNAHLAETLENVHQDQMNQVSLRQQIHQLIEENQLLRQTLKDAGLDAPSPRSWMPQKASLDDSRNAEDSPRQSSLVTRNVEDGEIQVEREVCIDDNGERTID